MEDIEDSRDKLEKLKRNLHSTNGMYIPKDYMQYPMDFASPVFEKKRMFWRHDRGNIAKNFPHINIVLRERYLFS